MKPSSLLLAGSVAINAGLVIFLATTGGPTPPASSSPVPPSATASAVSSRDPAAPDPATWTGLHSGELSTQRDRLRAEGFPPSAIRAILAAQVREGFSAQRKAIEATQGELPFWKNANSDPKIQAELRALSKQEQQAITDLLGPDPENSAAASLQRQLPGFPPEKVGEIAALRDRLNEQRNAIYSMGTTTADDRQKVMDLEKALRADIAAVLTPQEFEEYELRTSNTASNLRNTLSAFDPSEAEFRSLFKLQNAFNDQYQSGLPASASTEERSAYNRQRTAAQTQLTEDIKATLGPDRFADYQRSSDSYYRQTTQLVARLEMPVEAANQVYVVQKEIQQRVQSLASLPPDARNVQLAALAAEAEQRISATLGPTGYEAYKTNGGNWMTQLQPRAGPVATPPALR